MRRGNEPHYGGIRETLHLWREGAPSGVYFWTRCARGGRASFDGLRMRPRPRTKPERACRSSPNASSMPYGGYRVDVRRARAGDPRVHMSILTPGQDGRPSAEALSAMGLVIAESSAVQRQNPGNRHEDRKRTFRPVEKPGNRQLTKRPFSRVVAASVFSAMAVPTRRCGAVESCRECRWPSGAIGSFDRFPGFCPRPVPDRQPAAAAPGTRPRGPARARTR